MSLIEKTAKTIASRTAVILNLDKDHEEILQYGALNFLHTTLSFLLLVLFGALTKTLFEVLVISLSAALLRQFSGGVHATSSYRCAALSVLFFGGLSLAAGFLSLFLSVSMVLHFQILTFLLAVILICKYAPADNPNKRITNETTRKKLKKRSLCCVILYVFVTVILLGLYIRYNIPILLKGVICIHTGMIWQTFSITPMMRLIVQKLDSLLAKLHL